MLGNSKVETGSIHVYKLAFDTKTVQIELICGNWKVVFYRNLLMGNLSGGKRSSWIKTNLLGKQETLFRRPFLYIHNLFTI